MLDRGEDNMRKLRRTNLMCSGAVIAATLATPALAQSGNAASEARSGGDIIVTARRVEERLQDVPISITAYTQDQLQERNVVNFTDLALTTPSLSANTTFGDLNTNFAIRGFRSDQNTPPTVGTYFGDAVALRGGTTTVPVGDGAGPGSFFDLENVQVLKGPQGTLFGRNTTGGAILLVPKKPTDGFEGYIEGTYGNYDQMRVQGAVNARFGDARGRISIDRSKRDGYLRNTSGAGEDRLNDSDYLALRVSFVADLTPDLESYFILNYTHSDITGYGGHMFAADAATLGTQAGFVTNLVAAELARPSSIAGGFWSTQSTSQQFNKLHQWQLINKTSWTANDNLTVRNIMAYGKIKQQLSTEILTTFLDVSPLLGGIVPPRTPVAVNNLISLPGASISDQYTFTEELRLEGNGMGGRLVYQAGVYAEMSGPSGPIGQASASLLNCVDQGAQLCYNYLGIGAISQVQARVRYRNYGVYGQATYNFTDQLSLTGGLRYTWDRQKVDSTVKTFRFPRAIAAPAVPNSMVCTNTFNYSLPDCNALFNQKSSAPTWLIGLDYKPNDDVLVYAKYARGYRAGGIQPSAPQGFTTFEQEKLDNYEIGVKASFDGAIRGTFNIAAFYNDFSNQLVAVGFLGKPGTGLSANVASVNVGRSEIKGFEVEATVEPLDGLNFQVSYSYLDSKIKSIEPIVLDVASPYFVFSVPAKGSALTLTPKHQVSLAGSYTVPLGGDTGDLKFSANYNYVSGMNSTPAGPLTRIGNRDLVNATLSWDSIMGTGLGIEAFVTNLTKEKYYTYINYQGGVGSFGTVGQPRFYGVRVRYDF
jgi:iron complex outermembrane receptor protein